MSTPAPQAASLRVAVCDDSVLFREGLARVLPELGFEVAGLAAGPDALDDLLDSAAVDGPVDVAIVDIRMPPTHTDEGFQVAARLASDRPRLGVLLLSQVVEVGPTVALLQHASAGRGYLLKDRVTDLGAFAEAVRRVGAGGSVVDPEVAAALLADGRDDAVLAAMSARELEILSLMAEGRSNIGICERLVLSPRTVESHVRAIFRKLDLADAPDDHRRVLAVLAYLRR
ncbi:response regulator transcription factor [Nocardioides fonticola]|uniref:Response regulator transcription factor n=1 Tax=Nocardioides fonticola TaxID=450363 RepID=A0ABP7XCG3_9ACTN